MTTSSRLAIPTAFLLCLHLMDAQAVPATASDLLQGCPAQTVPAQRPGSIGAIVDAQVADVIKSQGLPSVTIEIARRGRPIYARAYGYADLAPCVRAHDNTDYQIGSVTKQFTAVAILQLQSAGRLELDDAVNAYLPAYKFDSRITLRMLLNQISGLQDYTNLPFPPDVLTGAPVAEQTILTEVAQAPLLFPPGTAYKYSNSNYFLLGSVIEAVTGLSYAEYLDRHILRPAGLHRTSYTQPPGAAAPYSYDNQAQPGTIGLGAAFMLDQSVPFAAGALWSDVGDLARWNHVLLSGRVLPAKQLELMMTPPAGILTFDSPAVPTEYGMGLIRQTLLDHTIVFHDGATVAYNSFNATFVDSGWSISILTNVDIGESTGTPVLANLTLSLIETLCTSKTVDADCFGPDHKHGDKEE